MCHNNTLQKPIIVTARIYGLCDLKCAKRNEMWSLEWPSDQFSAIRRWAMSEPRLVCMPFPDCRMLPVTILRVTLRWWVYYFCLLECFVFHHCIAGFFDWLWFLPNTASKYGQCIGCEPLLTLCLMHSLYFFFRQSMHSMCFVRSPNATSTEDCCP